MRRLEYHKKHGIHNSEEMIVHFLENIHQSIFDWSYFVDWDKARENTSKIEVELNILNSLIGKDDVTEQFVKLCIDYPKVRKALPTLLATRIKKIKELPIIESIENPIYSLKTELFSPSDPLDEEEMSKFFTVSGLANVFSDKSIKNLVDYCFGVEAGLNSNARKNRTGHFMEAIVKKEVERVCEQNDSCRYLVECNSVKIEKEFGYTVPYVKSDRRFDFAIDNGEKLVLIEANYYSSSGSKLKAVAGEFEELQQQLRGKFDFIWVTDGNGWKSTAKPLNKAIDTMDYVFSIDMIKNGCIEEVLES